MIGLQDYVYKHQKTLMLLLSVLIVTLYQGYKLLKNETLHTSAKYYLEDFFVDHHNMNLMLGSSSINWLDSEKYINCEKWLNRGIGNAVISDLTHYIVTSRLKISPSKILIYAGENDISRGSTTSKVIEEYQQLIELLSKKYPDSNLHIVAIKPSPKRQSDWDKYNEVNLQLKAITSNMPQVQLYSPKWDRKKNNFNTDGVHLTQQGYTTFTSGINLTCQSN